MGRCSFTAKNGNHDVTRLLGVARIGDLEKQMGDKERIGENKIFVARSISRGGDSPTALSRRRCKAYSRGPEDFSGAALA